MYASLSIADTFDRLHTSAKGLSDADIPRRRAEWGWNELPEHRRSLILLFLRQFNDVFVYILFAALFLSLLVPLLSHGSLTLEDNLDAFVIAAILLLNAVLGFVQEFKAEQAIALLRRLSSPHSRVRRNGRDMVIPSRELVPGDLLILEAGDRIAADARVVRVQQCEMNESSLTGESRPVRKTVDPLPNADIPVADRTNMLFAGTLVSRGTVEAVVTAIGTATEIGTVADLVDKTTLPETPLSRRMRTLSEQIGIIVVTFCGLIVLAGLLRGLSFFDILLTGISLAVSAVPEGLPAVVTVCFALGVRRMVAHNVLVRRLESLETLGSVTVICADKTGTITENTMKVVESWVPGEDRQLAARIGASCNTAELPDIGDPTEIGLLEYAHDTDAGRLPIDELTVPFSSEEKYMETRHTEGGRTVSYLKGAPEKILSLCVDPPAEAQERNAVFARDGLRVLAMARSDDGGKPRFVGLLAMNDPPRAGVGDAIRQAGEAGIRTIMITGDHQDTALAIARKVGISGDVHEGRELDALSPEALERLVLTAGVFARVSPVHKLLILQALSRHGEIVAMSGDGVNDAPALKGAHVGVAMGRCGTVVARDAASIIITDDNYATIVRSIREGRRIYDNIRKFLLFLLRANFDELLLIMTATLFSMPLPYLPIHILWINLMTDSLPALALSVEPEEPDIMRRPPRNPREPILAGEWGRLALAAFLAFSVTIGYFWWDLSRGTPLEEVRTGTFTLGIFFELFLVFTVRSRLPIWKIGIATNRWLLGAVAIPFLLQILLIFTPLRSLFHLHELTILEWLVLFALAASGFLLFEALKVFDLRRMRVPGAGRTSMR